MLMRDEKLAQLWTRFDAESGVLAIAKNDRVLRRAQVTAKGCELAPSSSPIFSVTGPKIAAQWPVTLLPLWHLRRQPGSPKRLSHRIAAGGPGGSEPFLRSPCGDFCACCSRPLFQSLIEPHCQRDPMAFWVNLQHLDTNNIAGLRDCAWVFHISIGHR